jgi:hypothetical protein
MGKRPRVPERTERALEIARGLIHD